MGDDPVRSVRNGAAKGRWRDQLLADRDLPALALHVALVLESFMSDAGEAWPSQATMAARLNVSERTIYNTTKAMRERSHLRWEDDTLGRGNSIHYWRVLRDPSASTDAGKQKNFSAFSDVNPEKTRRETQKKCVNKPRRKLPMNLPNESSKKNSPPPSPNERVEPEEKVDLPSADDLLKKLMVAAGGNAVANDVGPIFALMAEGHDLTEHILPAIAEVVPRMSTPLRSWGASHLVRKIRYRKANPGSIGSLEKATAVPVEQQNPGDRLVSVQSGKWTVSNLLTYLERWKADGRWHDSIGLKPDRHYCPVPDDVLAMAGLTRAPMTPQEAKAATIERADAQAEQDYLNGVTDTIDYRAALDRAMDALALTADRRTPA